MSNLTGRPVTPKGQRLKKKPNLPTAEQLRYREQVRSLGCIVKNGECRGRTTIQHCGTGIGRQKDHDAVIPLCWRHHLGDVGIDGKVISKPEWEKRYGTEESLIARTRELLQ